MRTPTSTHSRSSPAVNAGSTPASPAADPTLSMPSGDRRLRITAAGLDALEHAGACPVFEQAQLVQLVSMWHGVGIGSVPSVR